MSILRSALAQSTWLFGSRLIGAASQAVMLAALARQVTPDVLGILVAAMGVLAFCSGMAELGLGPYALRVQVQNGSVPRVVATLNRVTSFLLVAVGTLLTFVAVGFINSVEVTVYALTPLAFWAGTEKNSRLWSNILIGQERSRRVASIHFMHRMVALAIFLVLLYVLPDALAAYTVAITLAAALANRILYYSARKSVQQGSFESGMTRVIREAFPFMVNTLGMQIRNLDVSLVSLVGGATTAGLYGLPARLTSPLRMVPTAMAPIVLRLAAKGEPTHIKAISRLILITLLVSTLGLGTFVILAPNIIVGVFGDQYVNAVVPLQVLCIGLVFAFAVTLVTSLLQGLGRERAVGLVAVLSNTGALLFVVAGAAQFGAAGAAGGLSVSYLLHAIVLLIIWRNSSNA